MQIDARKYLSLLNYSTEEEKNESILKLAKLIDRKFSNQKVKKQNQTLLIAKELIDFQKHFISK